MGAIRRKFPKSSMDLDFQRLAPFWRDISCFYDFTVFITTKTTTKSPVVGRGSIGKGWAVIKIEWRIAKTIK